MTNRVFSQLNQDEIKDLLYAHHLAYFKEYATLNFPCNILRNENTLKVTPACNT